MPLNVENRLPAAADDARLTSRVNVCAEEVLKGLSRLELGFV
jgi:hypothetical protein